MKPIESLSCAALSIAAFLLTCGAARAQLSTASKASDLDAFKHSAFGSTSTGTTGGNLIPNWNFSDPTALKYYRYDFSYQDWYVDNAKYVTQVNQGGRNCAQITLPPGVAGNQGGKVETALVPIEPGARYRAEIDSMSADFAVKLYAEIYAPDPRPDAQRTAEESKGVKVTIARIPLMDGHPALVQVMRAQFAPDPPAHSNKWDHSFKEFTVPVTWRVAGKDVPPAFCALKGYVYDATPNGGKSYFTNFKLTKIKDAGATAAPVTSGPASNKDAVVR